MNYSVETLLEDLSKKFEGFSFEYEECSYTGKIPIFFVTVNCEESIFSDRWRKIVDFIGVHFQTSLVNEFSVWNIYVFFKVANDVSSSLKYQIENDTFSSRKIIVNKTDLNKEIINDHVLNTDLPIGREESVKTSFHKNSSIWKILMDKQPQKKITDKDKAAFKAIKGILKKD